MNLDELLKLNNIEKENSYNSVSGDVLKTANFNYKNSFSVNELVITPSLLETRYFYSCVTGMYSIEYATGVIINMVSVTRNFPIKDYKVSFSTSSVGKLPVMKG